MFVSGVARLGSRSSKIVHIARNSMIPIDLNFLQHPGNLGRCTIRSELYGQCSTFVPLLCFFFLWRDFIDFINNSIMSFRATTVILGNAGYVLSLQMNNRSHSFSSLLFWQPRAYFMCCQRQHQNLKGKREERGEGEEKRGNRRREGGSGGERGSCNFAGSK